MTRATRILLCWTLVSICASLCSGDCIDTERDALLHFKSGLTDPSNRLADWVADGSDCCKWTGVVCHNTTSHVIELHLRTLSYKEYFGPDELFANYSQYEEYYEKSKFGGKVSSSLLHLKRLSYLDLSYNDFGGFPIPEFFGSMQSLRYLNLSQAFFGGTIPPHLGNLSSLNYLNLAFMSLSVENLDWLLRLSTLEFLDLSGADLSQPFNWLDAMNSLPSLVELHLPSCRISSFNKLPLPYLNISSLAVLDLSDNELSGPIPSFLQNLTFSLRNLAFSGNSLNSSIPSWLYDFSHLQFLHLDWNRLQGQVSSRIGNLTSLISLNMMANDLQFEQGFPESFKNLCSLRSLDVTGIKLNQEINEILQILSSGCVANGLQSLNLADCQLSGHLTEDISHFKNLTLFSVSYNSISGPIPLSLRELHSLKYLDLSNNNVNGTFPVMLGHLGTLEYLSISRNQLEGEVSELHFTNLTRLIMFKASGMGKNIAFRVSSNWIPPLQLQRLSLGSCHIGSEFPTWVHFLKHLVGLDLSNTGISTQVPTWFWDRLPNYSYLNFSQNQMYGFVPNITFAGVLIYRNSEMGVDLSSNNFSGPLPYFSSKVVAVDLSFNSFSGSIVNFMCNEMNEVKAMEVLNLEGNLLSGEIPDCWSSWKKLEGVKLSNNKFSGKIPNSIGALTSLESLYLRNNTLSGEIPTSIQNCTELSILDVSNNNLVGNIQTWIGSGLPRLSILSLHGNKFDGYIPQELCGLVSLRILDLAHNKFSGSIPRCFSNFSAMALRNDYTGALYPNGERNFFENLVLVMKGKLMEYNNTLRLVRSIDLSANNISGEIPSDITSLAGLLSLNLSHNALSGKIPDDIGNMRWLEVIDFSNNDLSGEIPESLSRLHSLGTLNLSYNHFSGRIPLGTQIQSFLPSSFIGNQLCGLPLLINCSRDDTDPGIDSASHEEGNEDEEDWFYVSMGIGFFVAFSNVVGSLIFIPRWRHFYFRFVDNLWVWVKIRQNRMYRAWFS